MRRTQAERRAETTGRLLEATVSALAEIGYQGATTTEIARRAGVSRGAMLHHYPTRTALFTAASEWMVEGHIERFQQAMATIADEADRVEAAIDLLWEICSSPGHRAWFELATNARHEPDLAVTVASLGRHIRQRIRETWVETFPELQDQPLAEVAPDFAFSVLEGQATHQMIAPDPEAAAAVLRALKDVSVLLRT